MPDTRGEVSVSSALRKRFMMDIPQQPPVRGIAVRAEWDGDHKHPVKLDLTLEVRQFVSYAVFLSFIET